jgi:dipeptidyl aminopeptidase/acylaminoacyl peptidase
MVLRRAVFLCSFLFIFINFAMAERPMEIEDLFRIKRVSEPQLSPDGKWIAFVITAVDKPANKSNSDIYIIPSAGGDVRQLTNTPGRDAHPRWSPDSKLIAFESTRSGDSQIWLIDISSGIQRQFTTLSSGASSAQWSPDGTNIAFISSVYPEYSDKPFSESDTLNKQRDDEIANSKVKARIITKLLYRHWNAWSDNKRQHIFITPVGGGSPKDLTPGDRDAVPTSSTFSFGDDFAFSPDGKEIAYTATPTPPHIEAWSTNHDIYTVNIETGIPHQLTTNPAADIFPRYSPNGKYIAYAAQVRPGCESDKWHLMLWERSTGTTRSLTEHFDGSIEAFQWANNSSSLYFTSEEKANNPVWSVSLRGNDMKKIIDDAVNGDINVSANGKLLIFNHQTITRPMEIYSSSSTGGLITQLTHINDSLFSQLKFSKPESVWFTGANDTPVQMWIIKPPDFNPNKKYPLVFWVHGGPQGAWMNSWSYRWNASLWAAQEYVLALPNPRGSTGFGQQFTDEIRHDWGGKVFTDLMAGLAYVEKLPYIDTSRMAAAGASFGGYMMNWFQGHTDKFRTLITHCGTFNFDNSYGATEEVWFDEWEHGIPWETQDYDRYSPHKYAANFKTPNLIIHNELDFRIPYNDGMNLFTILQRKGIPSKLLTFPDEGHWVLKPLNSELWHKTVFEWLTGYLKK